MLKLITTDFSAMHYSINNLPTNWTNGMKINKLHFENSESSIFDSIHDSNSIHLFDFNFGLLEPSENQKDSLELTVVKSLADNFIVKLSRCRAVTYGGLRIEITPELVKEITFSTSLGSNISKNSNQLSYYLIVTVDYSSRVPSGNPDPKEEPLRYPKVHPGYALSLIESANYSLSDLNAYSLIIGKFDLKGNDLMWDKSYIPASLNMQCFPLLRSYYNSISEEINTIQVSLYNIIYKVINKNQNTPLSFNLKFVCERMIFYVSSLFFQYRFVLYQKSPIETVNSVVQIANHLTLSIDLLPEKEKEDLLLYFKEWSDVAPGKFDEFLTTVIEIDYNHQNLALVFEQVSEFTGFISELFKKLSELDLIGKKRGDKNMFVREINPKQTKKFKIID